MTEIERADMELVKTTCPYCGVGCGVIAAPDGKGGASIAGDPSHPANFGKLCSKGLALGETLGLETRVLHPMMRNGADELARVEWGAALDAVAEGFRSVLERDGPDAIAFYLSGQLLTEDYYVANKLMKGFLGSANVDTNSRLCMASSVAGHRRAFGADIVPGCYDDLDEADLIVLVGSNAAWCHPVLFQRMLRNKRERGAKIVVIDPRRTPTAEEADLHLAIAPGMDTALFAGLLVHLAQSQAFDRAFVETHTLDFRPALATAHEIAPDITRIAAMTALASADITTFYDWFTATQRTVTCYSQGVNQSAQGTDKVNAIINCHLATGRIGRPGMGPFSLTGQPNAMGGREVGGLANQLAAHMNFTPADIDRVRRFWHAPRMAERPGLKAVEMFEAIEQGRIKALWVMGTNPVASLPRGDAMAKAMTQLSHFVVSDNVRSNDTINAGAHLVLPAAAWGEKDGTVTNSERRISRQRCFLPLQGEARPDWWIVSQVAVRLGFGDAFAYGSASEIFAEHTALSGFENDGARAFDLSGLAIEDKGDFDHLEPFQWPVRRTAAHDRLPGQAVEQKRLFADGQFFTPDRRARFVSVETPTLATTTNDAFPLRLNTGRLRDQWHTMTRTGLSPRLCEHSPEPQLDIHPDQAARHNVVHGGFAALSTAHGSMIARVQVTPLQNRDSVFMAIHWTREVSPASRVSDLTGPATDPHSGQPEAKATPCAVVPVFFETQGFAVSRKRLMPTVGNIDPRPSLNQPFPLGEKTAHVSDAPISGGYVTRFSCHEPATSLSQHAPGLAAARFSIAEYRDDERGAVHYGIFDGMTCEALIFAARDAQHLPDVNAVASAFSRAADHSQSRAVLLSGISGTGGGGGGATVCACFGVRSQALALAIAAGATDVAALGKATNAGTNCGSCQPELRRLLMSSAAENAQGLNPP